MFRGVLILGCALAGANWAMAQPPEDVDPELLQYIEGIESDTGTMRFGLPILGVLGDGESEEVMVKVDPSTYTFITLICGPSCEEISGAALDSAGKEVAKVASPGYDAVIQLPPGHGDAVKVRVDMDFCDWDSCPYAIQAFTRPGS